MISAKHKKKFKVALALAAFCFFTGAVMLAKEKLENVVQTAAELQNSKVIVLDAGHGGYVLNIVI